MRDGTCRRYTHGCPAGYGLLERREGVYVLVDLGEPTQPWPLQPPGGGQPYTETSYTLACARLWALVGDEDKKKAAVTDHGTILDGRQPR